MPLVAQITGEIQRGEEVEALAAGVVAAGFPYPSTVARLGLALLAVQRGDVQGASEQYTTIKDLPRMVLLFNSTDRVLGLLSVTMGRLDQAEAHFEDGLAFTRRAGYRPELAWTCFDYADSLVRRNSAADRARAASLLEESMTIAQDLGMRPLSQRIEASRERLESQPDNAPAFPDGLTQREVEVLQLLAQGKSNSQISQELVVAEGTTRRHVANIYEKIGVVNRAEATRYALREGLLSLEESPSSDPEL